MFSKENTIALHLRARNGSPGNAKQKHESQYAVLTTNARNIQQHAIAEILRARTGRPRLKDNDTMTQHTIQECELFTANQRLTKIAERMTQARQTRQKSKATKRQCRIT